MQYGTQTTKKRVLYKPTMGVKKFEHYIIENETDLEAFDEAMGGLPKIMTNPMRKCLSEGRVLLATDVNRLSGYPTYCFESSKDNTHPQSLHRVK